MRHPCGLLVYGPGAFPRIRTLVPELKLSLVGAVGAIVGAVGAIVGAVRATVGAVGAIVGDVGAIVKLKFSLKLIKFNRIKYSRMIFNAMKMWRKVVKYLLYIS